MNDSTRTAEPDSPRWHAQRRQCTRLCDEQRGCPCLCVEQCLFPDQQLLDEIAAERARRDAVFAGIRAKAEARSKAEIAKAKQSIKVDIQ